MIQEQYNQNLQIIGSQNVNQDYNYVDYQQQINGQNPQMSQENQQNQEEEDAGFKQLMSKKKEQHRVEIRRKQNQEKFKMNRIQVSYIQDQQKLKDFSEKDKLDVDSLNINQCIDGFIQAYHTNNFELIKFQVLCIRHCVTLEHKIKDLEFSNKVIFEKGLMQFLITYLSPQYDDDYELQRDAIWIIAHFLSEQNLRHILYILENVPLQTFFRLLEQGQKTIKEYALLSINNIMDENPIGVKLLVENGIIQIVRNLVLNFLPNNQNLVQSTIRIINTLISYSQQSDGSQIPIENLMPIIEVILPLFQYVKQDEELTDDLFETIQKITQRDDDDIDHFYQTCNGIILKTLHYIKDNQKSARQYLITPLRIIQNLTNSYDDITENLIQFGLLDMISMFVKHRSTQIRNLILHTLSNVCASGAFVIDYIMQHKIIIMDMINIMESGEFILKKEATIAFCNIFMVIKMKQIEEFLTDYNGIQLLVDQIKYVDVDLNISIVKALYRIIKIGEKIKNKKNYFYNIYAKKFNQYGGRERVQGLAESQNKDLKRISEKLLAQSYIVDEVEEEMEQQYQEENEKINNESQEENESDQDDNDDDGQNQDLNNGNKHL
ncbi:importin subunit alpha, putative (macronuclear) [Tetrahymena thermophila SB210]|uniref:Importin subunit alpha, putative n=1 Tax=Tetrahymena thermophila (strain SB210) TaxID=312017 RepID=Q22VX0_TETTS|nr:importin subunit alpha, putative [Tetrahymena thermophila SB210]EAR89646.2 importin subunit alpha, putative [Tetrahymena thermophila SB210]|eukprot:XP_001009892.2 importin subunit alpha, putative [Tetrahymena thermophila SB210]